MFDELQNTILIYIQTADMGNQLYPLGSLFNNIIENIGLPELRISDTMTLVNPQL